MNQNGGDKIGNFSLNAVASLRCPEMCGLL